MRKFHSIKAVEKHYWPKQYYKDMEERAIEKLGFGEWLARRYLAELRKKLK